MKRTQKNQLFQILLSMLLLSSFIPATAQTEKKVVDKFYLQMGAGPVSQEGSCGEFSLQAIFKNKWSITISHQAMEMKYNNIPTDYKPSTSTTYILGFPFSSTGEVEPMNMKLFNLTAGRNFNITKRSWVTAEAGVSFVKGQEAVFTRTAVTSDYYNLWLIGGDYTSSNYITTIENKSSIGAMLKADINCALSPYLGLGAGMFANFNEINSPIGFQVKLMIGKMGVEKNQKQQINRNQHRSNKKIK